LAARGIFDGCRPRRMSATADAGAFDAAMARVLACGAHRFELSRPLVMGILNVTPDSFSDGGHFVDPARALRHARTMAADGADLIDVGGESTRPGAKPVPEDEELARIVDIVRTLAREGMAVSVDTRKPTVMRAVIAEGAAMINDVSALSAPGALDACAGSSVGVCLMHMRGEPATMQQAPRYDDIVSEVCEYLGRRAEACVAAGIARERIVIDPGFGFGKTLAHNLLLLRGLNEIAALGLPVMAGLSRKSSLGQITGRPSDDRLPASLAAALVAVARGAAIVRVHDVRETIDALKVWCAGAQP